MIEPIDESSPRPVLSDAVAIGKALFSAIVFAPRTVALVFQPQVDITGLATIALALFTFGLALATIILVFATRSSVAETRKEIALHRQEVEEGHRPILIPIIDQMQSITRVDAPPESLVPFVNQRIFVPIRNIGVGPALKVLIQLALSDIVENTGSGSEANLTSGLAGVGAGETRIPSLMPPSPLTRLPDFQLRIAYDDVTGRHLWTKARYAADRAAFLDLEIGP